MVHKNFKKKFFSRDTIIVAQELLGKKIVHRYDGIVLSGIIVETEAYILSDPACHAYRGKTKSNEALFGPVGHAYIYFIYGNHNCINVVAHSKKQGAGGVLIRALEPIDGIDKMKKNRKIENIKNLTNGPGKLTQALQITKKDYGIDLIESNKLYITDGIHVKKRDICSSPRIGISHAQDRLWRFFICENKWVSKRSG